MSINKRDTILSLIVTIQLIIATVQLILPLTGIFTIEAAATFRVVATLATFLPGVLVVFFNYSRRILVPFVAYFIFLFFQYIFFPASHSYIESSAMYTLTPISLLTAIFMMSIVDINRFSKYLRIVSRIAPIVAFLYVLLFNFSPFRDFEKAYDMSFGYSMLLPAMFLFSQDKLIDKLLSIVLLFFILFGGSRGPAIVLFMFYVVDILMFMPSKHKGRFVFSTILVFFFIIIILPHYLDYGSSRTLMLLGSGELLSHDGGRGDDLYSVVIPHIFERPVFGWGVGADRFFLDGAYCHNVVYEIFLSYGIIGGSILFLLFFVWFLNLFFSKRLKMYRDERILFVLLSLYGLVPLMASNSYLIFYNFAIMIGYMIWLNKPFREQIK